MKNYRLIYHTADIGIEVFGKTQKELFANAVEALFDLMLEQKLGQIDFPAGAAKSEKREIIVAGDDPEDLLINFLREILYLFNGELWVTTGCRFLEISTKRIVAELSGLSYDPQKHCIKMEIKAVTYHGLSVKKNDSGWKARVIFDV